MGFSSKYYIIKTVCLFCLGLFICTGTVFAGFVSYAAGAGFSNPENTVSHPPWLGSALPQADGTARDGAAGRHSKFYAFKPDFRAYDPDEAIPEPGRTAVERLYSKRSGYALTLFGHDLFGKIPKHSDDTRSRTGFPKAALQDDYSVRPGDTLNIVISGQMNFRSREMVNSQGYLVVENLPPVFAAGRSIREVRQEITAIFQDNPNTSVFVTIDSIRQIDVLVIGHVHKPGRIVMTTFDNALDAIMLAGGIRKSGSLRNIKLVRTGTGRSYAIDLYALIAGNENNADMVLKDGDRIIVPPLGETVALAGDLQTPAIFELKNRDKISVQQIMEFAGNVTARENSHRFLKIAPDDKSRDKAQDISAILNKNGREKTFLRENEILIVERKQQNPARTVTLKGHTDNAGKYALDSHQTLRDIFEDPSLFLPGTYPLLGVIERKTESGLATELLNFPPFMIANKTYDRLLQEGDIITLFSENQIRHLMESERQKETYRNENSLLQTAAFNTDDDQQSLYFRDNRLRNFLKEHRLAVFGSVRRPGHYPAAEGIPLRSVIDAAGGLKVNADPDNIELTFASAFQKQPRRTHVNLNNPDHASITLGPGDIVQVRQHQKVITKNTVRIEGEIRFPGEYNILPGDTLLSLLERAGGFTAQAYPEGAVFSRESERRRQKQAFLAQAQELELRLAEALNTKNNEDTDPAQIAMVRDLITRLKKADAAGRVTIEADSAALNSDPDLDVLLESGDHIFIPKRPAYVRVAGEVLSPAALQFREDKSPRDYLREAGLFTSAADKSKTFIVFPDGSAAPLYVESWNYEPVMIPPGSTIIVPPDAEPFRFLDIARDITQIITNLTVSVLFAKEIGDD